MEQRSEITERKARTILLNGVRWTTRKNPATGEVFFLDFDLYSYQDLAGRSDDKLQAAGEPGTITELLRTLYYDLIRLTNEG